MKPILLVLLVAFGCATPFDPMAWRTQDLTICEVAVTGTTCQLMRCEVRGSVPHLAPGARVRIVDPTEREYRNCRPLA